MDSKEDELKVGKILDNLDGVDEHSEDYEKQLVLVKSSLTSVEIAEALEKTGKQVRIRGLGNQGIYWSTTFPTKTIQIFNFHHFITTDKANLGAAVCILQNNPIKGVARFIQLSDNRVLVEATVHGLTPGKHGIHIYSSGNIQNHGEMLKNHYNPKNLTHGHPLNKESHAGDLGNLDVNEDGKVNFRVESTHFSIADIIGRGLAITENEDDLGKENNEESKISGNSGKIIVCGVIARSSGLFQNPKKICLCSGATIWEEDKVGWDWVEACNFSFQRTYLIKVFELVLYFKINIH